MNQSKINHTGDMYKLLRLWKKRFMDKLFKPQQLKICIDI